VAQCHSSGSVISGRDVGGLVGLNYVDGMVLNSYSTATVSGGNGVGGLVGGNGGGHVTNSYSTGVVSGDSSVGGLTGGNSGNVTACFWDTQTSGQATSSGGTGKTTAEMQMQSTFTDAGWDFVGETANGMEDIWKIAEGLGYPRLAWEKYSGGTGEPNDPYLIFTAEQMNAIGTEPNDWGKHFKLMADIDLSGFDAKEGRPSFNVIGDCYYNLHYGAPSGGIPFTGVFDGNGHTVSHLTVEVRGRYKCGGLFSGLGSGGEVKNLGIVDVNVILFGPPDNDDECYWPTGGLAGHNYFRGSLTQCHSSGAVSGDVDEIGGLVGTNWGSIAASYSTGMVSGGRDAGGLAGSNPYGSVDSCFWDTQTSGQTTSAGGTGKTTAEMQVASAFLDAGWDFVGETANGTEDIWWILEGQDYPRLWWETDGN
jgi:hypothetical protein